MNTSNVSETVIIAVTIFVIIFVIILLYLAYYFYGSPYEEYIIIAMVITFFVIGALIAYYVTYAPPSTVPFGVVTPASGSNPPVTGAVKFGDIIALDNLYLRVGTITCDNGFIRAHPVVSSPTLGNKVWAIQGGPIGMVLSYGNTITLQNILGGFPSNLILALQADVTFYRLYLPDAQVDTLTFTVVKGVGNTSTSTTVMYGDGVALTANLGGVSYMTIINTSDPAGGSCGNQLDLTPLTNPVTPAATFTIN